MSVRLFSKATTSTPLFNERIHHHRPTVSDLCSNILLPTLLNQAQEHSVHSHRLLSTEDQISCSSQAGEYLHPSSRQLERHVASLSIRINPMPQISGWRTQALSLRPPTPPKRMDLPDSHSRPCPPLPSAAPPVVYVRFHNHICISLITPSPMPCCVLANITNAVSPFC